MRFIGFVILLGVAAMMLGRHHRVSFDYAQAQPMPDRIRYDHDSAWESREFEGDHKFQPVDDWGTGFDWSKMSMAIVMLVGGTVVCRRIFRSTPGQSRPVQLRYRPNAPAVRPSAAAPDRICSRADCNRMNPSMARFCRRCGARLKDA
jgi:hypothetical protein